MGGRIVGIGGKPLKTELHHWWPSGVSKLWSDTDGMVTRLSWEGKAARSKPERFGAVTNAHHVILDGPWAGTVEPIFDNADTHFPALVKKLLLTRPKPARFKKRLISRLVPTPLDEDDRMVLGEAVASLVLRSPAYRHYLKADIIASQRRFGAPASWKFDDNLIALSINNYFPIVCRMLQKGGRAILLHSWHHEFIMGEGYLNDILGQASQPNYRCLLPLTPNLSVLLFKVRERLAEPNCLSIALNEDEVAFINAITQIYTKDSVFFRNQRPHIETVFAERRFGQIKNHSHQQLENMLEAATKR